MAGIGFTPRRSMAAEDIRNLQRRARHARRALSRRLVLGLLFGLVLLGHQRSETIQRAHDLADRVGGDTRVERRRIKFGVTEQDLNHSDIGVLFQQMGGEAVAQGVRCHALGDLGHMCRGMAGAGELPRRQGVDRVLTGE